MGPLRVAIVCTTFSSHLNCAPLKNMPSSNAPRLKQCLSLLPYSTWADVLSQVAHSYPAFRGLAKALPGGEPTPEKVPFSTVINCPNRNGLFGSPLAGKTRCKWPMTLMKPLSRYGNHMVRRAAPCRSSVAALRWHFQEGKVVPEG